MNLSSKKILETRIIYADLGLRFWDPVTDRAIGDGLEVTARSSVRNHGVSTAAATLSGNYVFHRLPGISRETKAETRPFLIRVADQRGRFSECFFHVDLPLSYTGLYRFNGTPAFFLFSAPSRRVSTNMAVVRAQLEDVNGKAAAYALLEIETEPGMIHYGIADPRGMVLVPFVYPPFTPSLNAQSSSLDQQSWTLTIRVRHEPQKLVFYPGSALPGLRSITSQKRGWIHTVPSAVQEWRRSLNYQRELVLRTDNAPVLRIGTEPPD